MSSNMTDSDSDADSSSSGYSYHDELIIAHAVLASTAILFLIPAAVLVGRYLRARPVWYTIHSCLNYVAIALLSIVFILGMVAVGGGEFSDDSGGDTHHRLGLATFLLVWVQGIVGFGAHYTKPGFPRGLPAPGKNWVRYVHAAMGVGVAGTAYATIYSGFNEWEQTADAGTLVPTGVRAVYWVLFGVAVAAYVAGFWFRRYKGLGRDSTSSIGMRGKEQEAAENGT